MSYPTVDVLVVVDVEGAQTNGLSGNVYMIDTNGYFGSYTEGGNELHTAIYNTQPIIWNVAPVDPNTNAQITEFTGQMVNDGICTPKEYDSPTGSYWEAVVQAQSTTGSQQYTMTLSFDGGAPQSFDPFLLIQAAG